MKPEDFNSFGARRGNHEVMMRGTFANIRLKNLLVPGVEGGVTRHLPSGEQLSIYDAAMRYQKEGVPLVVLAARSTAPGSSPRLGRQGHHAARRARGHRQVLRAHPPLEPGRHGRACRCSSRRARTRRRWASRATRVFSIDGIAEGLAPMKKLTVTAGATAAPPRRFTVTARIDTPNELDYYRHGGILQYVLRQLAKA